MDATLAEEFTLLIRESAARATELCLLARERSATSASLIRDSAVRVREAKRDVEASWRNVERSRKILSEARTNARHECAKE